MRSNFLRLFSLISISLLNSAEASKRVDPEQYRQCYIGWLDEENQAKIFSCFNDFEKGIGFMVRSYSRSKRFKEPEICQNKTKYKIEDGKILIKIKGSHYSCTRGSGTPSKSVSCVQLKTGKLSCSTEGQSKFELHPVKKDEI